MSGLEPLTPAKAPLARGVTMPRKSIKVERVCETCGVHFFVKPCLIKAGLGHYCSRKCYLHDHQVSLEVRFWRQVAAPDSNGCMLWTGCSSDRGYGVIHTSTIVNRKQLLTHRVAW